MRYWLDLFTGTTWQEFVKHGSNVSGFSQNRWKTVQKIKVGDRLICYVTGISRFIGMLEVTGPAFQDESPIWQDMSFPARLKVKPIIALEFHTAVPVMTLKDKLSMFQDLKNPLLWSGAFRGSPAEWKAKDGEIIFSALEEAKRNPVSREFDERKLLRKPVTFQGKTGLVTIPENEQEKSAPTPAETEVTPHEEIQWLLANLGNEMGLDIWIARNDRNKRIGNKTFSQLSNLKTELPLRFDPTTNRTIELIDVLWLKGNAIVAAFEIENSTSVYSGLLRMGDLVSLQPNLNIPLFLVAPDDRRDKVFSEINRPMFSQLATPMSQICKFIPYSSLREKLAQHKDVLKHLKPDFLVDISESGELE